MEWSLDSFVGEDEPEEFAEVVGSEGGVEGRSEEFSDMDWTEIEGPERLGDRERGDAASEGEVGECAGEEEFDGLLRIGEEDEIGEVPSDLSLLLRRCSD